MGWGWGIGPMLLKKVETYAYVSIFPGHPPTPRGGMGGPYRRKTIRFFNILIVLLNNGGGVTELPPKDL